MCRYRINFLPVVDDLIQLKGIITARDIASIFIQSEKSVTRGEFVGESIRLWDASIKGFFDKNPLIMSEDKSIKHVVEGFKKFGKKICIVKGNRKFNIITPLEIIKLFKLKVKDTFPIRFLGAPFYSQFIDIDTVRDKVFRVLERSYHKDIREVIIDIKRRKRSGKRILYQITAQVYMSGKPLIISAQGWYLAEAVNNLCNKLDKIMIKEKERNEYKNNKI